MVLSHDCFQLLVGKLVLQETSAKVALASVATCRLRFPVCRAGIQVHTLFLRFTKVS